jgi:hypothetical protein
MFVNLFLISIRMSQPYCENASVYAKTGRGVVATFDIFSRGVQRVKDQNKQREATLFYIML